MRFRTHDDEQRRETQPANPEAPQGPNLGVAGAEFLAAADEAIARVLSGDAESFLRANKQQGGQ
jgi:hypothetical protein